MKRDEFTKAIDNLVLTYIECPGKYDTNPQIRINPASLSVGLINGREMMDEIEEADETVENAAGAEGALSEDITDYQASQIPDFYPVKELVLAIPGSTVAPDSRAIVAIADTYFPL